MTDETIIASIRYRKREGPEGGHETSVWINGVRIPGLTSVSAHNGVRRAYRLELEVAVDDLVVVDIDANKISRPSAAPADDRAHYLCPHCGAVSYNPHDLENGYCGHCKQWREDAMR